MRKALVLLPLVLSLSVLSPLMIAQNDGIPVHGGGADVLVNDCAAVERMADGKAPIEDAQGIQYCFGYIFGIVDMRDILNAALSNPKDGPYCVPPNASATQLAKVVARYGVEHPEELNEAALLMVSNALSKAFPCK